LANQSSQTHDFCFELSNGMAATAKAMEPEHPDAASTDTQGITVWIFAIILHPVLMWGRTDEKTVAIMFHEFGSMMRQDTAEGAWDLDELSSEIDRCQRLLRTHASSLNYEGVKEAASGYFRGLTRLEPRQR